MRIANIKRCKSNQHRFSVSRCSIRTVCKNCGLKNVSSTINGKSDFEETHKMKLKRGMKERKENTLKPQKYKFYANTKQLLVFYGRAHIRSYEYSNIVWDSNESCEFNSLYFSFPRMVAWCAITTFAYLLYVRKPKNLFGVPFSTRLRSCFHTWNTETRINFLKQ